MTKKEKISSLATAMTIKTRADGREFYTFTDTAPKELTSLFLEHYQVADLDYETFSKACDIVSEIYADTRIEHATNERLIDYINERSDNTASIYTSTRLSYLNNNNEHDISDVMKEYNTVIISTACAIWYEKQVEQAAMRINKWVKN